MDEQIKTEAQLRAAIEQNAIVAFDQAEKNTAVLAKMLETLSQMRLAKPKERGEVARRFAVSITEFEMTIAYFRVYVVDD